MSSHLLYRRRDFVATLATQHPACRSPLSPTRQRVARRAMMSLAVDDPKRSCVNASKED
jgi:hypothetical protein